MSMESAVMSFLSFVYYLFVSLFFLVSLSTGLSILLIYSQKQLLVLVVFLYRFPVFNFTDFCVNLFSFLLHSLDLIFSSFSSFLRWEHRLLLLNLSSFLIYSFDAINFHLSTAFTASHKFLSCAFIFTYFKIFENSSILF